MHTVVCPYIVAHIIHGSRCNKKNTCIYQCTYNMYIIYTYIYIYTYYIYIYLYMHIIYMHLYAKLLNRNDMQLPKYLFPHAHREYSQGSLGIKVTQNKTSWKFGQHSGLLYIYMCVFLSIYPITQMLHGAGIFTYKTG